MLHHGIHTLRTGALLLCREHKKQILSTPDGAKMQKCLNHRDHAPTIIIAAKAINPPILLCREIRVSAVRACRRHRIYMGAKHNKRGRQFAGPLQVAVLLHIAVLLQAAFVMAQKIIVQPCNIKAAQL